MQAARLTAEVTAVYLITQLYSPSAPGSTVLDQHLQEPLTRIELVIPSLPRRCITTLLQGHYRPGGNRTRLEGGFGDRCSPGERLTYERTSFSR